MTTTNINDTVGFFVMKIRDTKAENNYFNIQLPLNGNDFDEMLNDKIYKKTINKLYDAG